MLGLEETDGVDDGLFVGAVLVVGEADGCVLGAIETEGFSDG